jgi:regulator of protease activity HflC (stomatin/prohibitin superfamily)
MDDSIKSIIKLASAAVLVLGGGVGSCMYGMPMYNVYHQKMEGEAELAKANFSKQVMVQEAQAKMDAATMLANAEVERAKGVAKANQIIGDSLKNNEDYLRYLFVNNLEHTQNQVIYVPTEANLPILESRRLK